MDIRKLQRVIVDGLAEVKGQNILVFNTEHLSALFERVIIVSGTSNRHTKALAANVRDAVKSSGFLVLRTEGEANGEWVIVDCAAAVVHIMQPAIREYYHLEEIWGDKPVKMKMEAVSTRLVKASAPDRPVARKSVAEKPVVAKKVIAKKKPLHAPSKAPTTKVAAKKMAASKNASKAPAQRAPTPKVVVTRTVGVKKSPVAKASGVRAPAVKKPAVKKPAAKKAVTKAGVAQSALPKKATGRK